MWLEKGPYRGRKPLFWDKDPCFGSWISAQHSAVHKQVEKLAWTAGEDKTAKDPQRVWDPFLERSGRKDCA